MKQFLGLVMMAFMITALSCRKREDPVKHVVVPNAPEVSLKFINVVGIQPLALNGTEYTNEHGDKFTVSTYSYYISNISLTTTEGQIFVEPESYHLIKETEPGSKTFTIKNLPSGNYTSIKFLIGVDEARNKDGAQTGALDPINGMFWDWNTGYIMAKIEGNSPQSPTPQGFIAFHMGGFTDKNSVLRWVTLPLPTAAVVGMNKSPVINIRSDASEWFKTPVTIDFSQLSIVNTESANAKKMADNYSDMFSIDHVDN